MAKSTPAIDKIGINTARQEKLTAPTIFKTGNKIAKTGKTKKIKKDIFNSLSVLYHTTRG